MIYFHQVVFLIIILLAVGIDGGEDLDPDLLRGIYDRVKQSEFKPGADHVQQVMKVEQMIVGKKPVSSNICVDLTLLF